MALPKKHVQEIQDLLAAGQSKSEKREDIAWKIIFLSNEINKYAHRMSKIKNEYTQEKCMKKIMELNEQIEKEYSSNWHK